MKYTGGEDPKSKLKPTAKELEAANQFVKRFSLRNNLIFGEDAHVGDKIPPFIDSATGMDLTGVPQKLPSNIITDIKRIPSYVTADSIVKGKDGLSYFEDQATGDFIPIHPDILRTPRFNPNRGKTLADVGLASNVFGNRFASNF